MALMDRLRNLFRGQTVYIPPLPFPPDLFMPWVTMNGNTYGLQQTLTGSSEQIGADFKGLVEGAYKRNGIVYACIQARFMLLSQARFQFQQLRGGQPGDLFSTPALDILERPEPGKVTADLLARASVHVDLAGNAFVARRPNGRLKLLHPAWVTIILGSQQRPELDVRDIDAEVIGYVYYPGGRYSGLDPELLLPEDVAHMAPIPDPLHRHRGMSWLNPTIGEIASDTSATVH